MSDGTGIAGAQDYVPTKTKAYSWVCVSCQQEFTVASAVVWARNGLQHQCNGCHTRDKKLLAILTA